MSKTKFCPECGTKILETQKFCAECGYNFEEYNKTVGVFPESEKKSGEGTIGVFETRKEKNEKEKNVKKDKKPGTPIYKKWYVWAVATVIIIIGLITAFGGWGIVSDVAMYDENDTSDRIVLDKEIPDPLTLSYYDYMMVNCPEKKTEVWEETSEIKGHAPKYQVNVNDIQGKYIDVTFRFRVGFDSVSKEDFNNTVRILKDRLDMLETPYAIMYMKDSGDSPYIKIRTGVERMGQPVITMLEYTGNKKGEDSTSDSRTTKLVSQMADCSLLSVTDFSFKKKMNGEYDMFLSISPERVQESTYIEFSNYLKEHVGETIYWVLADDVTVASLPIEKGMDEELEFVFSEIAFLNNRKPMAKESFLLKLLYYSLQGEQYPIRMEAFDYHFSDDADNTSLGYHIWTSVDESMKATTESVHSNVKVYRDIKSVKSELNIEMLYEENTFTLDGFIDSVKKIYLNNSAISSGSYGYVYISAIENGDNMIRVRFIKDMDGKVYMDSLAYSSGEVDEEGVTNILKNDDVFGSIYEE